MANRLFLTSAKSHSGFVRNRVPFVEHFTRPPMACPRSVQYRARSLRTSRWIFYGVQCIRTSLHSVLRPVWRVQTYKEVPTRSLCRRVIVHVWSHSTCVCSVCRTKELRRRVCGTIMCLPSAGRRRLRSSCAIVVVIEPSRFYSYGQLPYTGASPQYPATWTGGGRTLMIFFSVYSRAILLCCVVVVAY